MLDLLVIAALGMLSGVVVGFVVWRFLRRDMQRWFRQFRTENISLFSLGFLPIVARAPLPPLGPGTLGPYKLLVLLRLVTDRKPETIVELGAGASTAYLALSCSYTGLQTAIWSVEHNQQYVDEVKRTLRSLSLDNCNVIHAPIRDGWYDLKRMTNLPEKIDLLIVDGPPNRNQENIRAPFFANLDSRLASGSLIFVDDTDRPSERRMVEAILERSNVRLEADDGRFCIIAMQ